MHVMTRLSAAATLLALTATAQAECTATTIKGVWGFSYDATDLLNNRYCAGLGLMTFNTGNLSNNTVKVSLQRESCNGEAGRTGSASGTYSVSSTCTAKSTNLVYSPGGKTAKLDINIVETGTTLQFFLVINGITLHGEAVKR